MVGPIRNPLALPLARILARSPIRHVAVLGGEPTLCLNLLSCLRVLLDAGMFVELITNGVGVTDAMCSLFCSAGPMVRVKVSLDSADGARNDALRGDGAFAAAAQACQRLRSFSVPFRIQSVLVDENSHDIAATYDLACSLGAYSYGFAVAQPIGRGARLRAQALDNDALAQVACIVGYQGATRTRLEKFDLGWDTVKEVAGAESRRDPTDPREADILSMVKCNALRSRVHVASNGDVFPCDFLTERRYLCGNLLTDGLMSAWQSHDVWSQVRALRRSRKPVCASCPFTSCTTGCAAILRSHQRHHPNVQAFCEIGAAGHA